MNCAHLNCWDNWEWSWVWVESDFYKQLDVWWQKMKSKALCKHKKTKLALFLFINTGVGWEGGPRAQVGENSGLDYLFITSRWTEQPESIKSKDSLALP